MLNGEDKPGCQAYRVREDACSHDYEEIMHDIRRYVPAGEHRHKEPGYRDAATARTKATMAGIKGVEPHTVPTKKGASTGKAPKTKNMAVVLRDLFRMKAIGACSDCLDQAR